MHSFLASMTKKELPPRADNWGGNNHIFLIERDKSILRQWNPADSRGSVSLRGRQQTGIGGFIQYNRIEGAAPSQKFILPDHRHTHAFMLGHDNIDYFLHAFPVRLGITEIRSAPLRCSERQGYINRYLQVFIIEYGFKHAEKMTIPTELMITIGTSTIFTITSASLNGLVKISIKYHMDRFGHKVLTRRNQLEYCLLSFFAYPIQEPITPWSIAAKTQARVLIRSGNIRYRCIEAMTAVVIPDTGPPRNPADSTPITRALGSALPPGFLYSRK